MALEHNPFVSDIFTKVYTKHFNNSKPAIKFNFIQPICFLKNGHFPIFTNVGSTFTKGINYSLTTNNTIDYKNKVFLIFDVPTFFKVETTVQNKNLGLYKSKQYPGFLVQLDTFTDLPHYMTTTFSKSSRYKLNKYKKRFEQCFNIEYRMFYGDINKSEYDEIFNSFRKLLEKRFDEKKVENNNLRPEEWNFYEEVAYPMILNKKASLFVIYDSGKPIGVTLNYFSDTELFDAITVFDIDYSKFHLGSITIMKLIEWSIENKMKIFDFSKGYFDYKTRWSNKSYDFEYHIYYDKTSFIASIIALGLKKFYDFKQYLRDKNINDKLHKITYRIKGTPTETVHLAKYKFVDIDTEIDLKENTPINTNSLDDALLKSIIFDFLYLNNECMINLKAYELNNKLMKYLLVGASTNKGVTIEN